MQRVSKKRIIKISNPLIGFQEEQEVINVLRSGHLSQGKKVKSFEERFANYIGTKYAVAVSNGTDALFLSLLSLGIGRGDEVITTSFSFIATANAIIQTGAKPVFVDINAESFNIDENKIEEKITPRTKAIIPVHLFGLPANMRTINKVAKKYKLYVIEDACQAHGATYFGRKVGSLSDVGCFSFYPTKNMTTGEGGIVTTNRKEIAEKISILRNQGMKITYYHLTMGYNKRMTDISAALGLVQLRRLASFNRKRKAHAKQYQKILKIPGIILPKEKPNFFHVYHQFTIRVSDAFPFNRDEVREKLLKENIETGVYYPLIIPRQEAYSSFRGEYNIAEKITSEVLSLPVHPGITSSDVQRICRILISLSKQNEKKLSS